MQENNLLNNEQPTTPVVQKPKKVKKERRFSFLTVIVSVLLALMVGTTSGGIASAIICAVAILNTENPATTIEQIIQGANNGTVNIDVQNLDASMAEAVAQKVTPSVVGIKTTVAVSNFFGGTEESSGEGSGVIYKDNGYIITNYHVISDAVDYSGSAEILVFLGEDNQNGYKASVVGYNISCDLAVIKINGKDLPVIEWGDSSELKVGQTVVAIGNPGGLEFMGSVTMGIVSGLNRVVSDTYDSETVQLIQTDAAINPGNSGGALVNASGQLIGINSSKIVSEGFEGMGFAIPSNTVKEICDKIISKEYEPTPYIGVTISERYTASVLTSLGYPAGAVVYSVTAGSPAASAGIKQGDIITKFNGVDITDYTKLYSLIAQCSPGDKVNFVVYRAGSYKSGSLTVGSNNS